MMNDGMNAQMQMVSGWGVPVSAWGSVATAFAPTLGVEVLPPGDKTDASSGARYLGGWSLGGQIALAEALRAPERCRGLLLIATTPRFCSGPDQDWGTPRPVLDAMIRALETDAKEVLHRFYRLCAQPLSPLPGAEGAWAKEMMEGGPAPLINGLRYLRDADLRADLQKVSCPVVILQGAEDAVVPVEAAHRLAAAMPHAEIRMVEGVGHDLPLRRPDLLRDAARRLLEMAS